MSNMTAEPAFAGRRVLVTGGASGIGLATAQMLRSQGATVAVIDAAAGPDGFLFGQADISDDKLVEGVVVTLIAQLGGLDVLINNAGAGARGSVEDNPLDEWRRVLDINVLGLVRVTRAALPALRASGSGAIVNTCSIAATVGLPQRALYSASKGAVLSLTLAMAADLMADGVRVNAVNPGTVDTPWVRRLLSGADDPVEELARLEARQPSGRLVSADEVAAAICYLASPAAGSTTGTALAVDGGLERIRLPAAQ
jgi:2-keto-3-deoxy-L-fuconate dehydrogenase